MSRKEIIVVGHILEYLESNTIQKYGPIFNQIVENI